MTCGGAELFHFQQDVPQDLLQSIRGVCCQGISQRQQRLGCNCMHIITLVLQQPGHTSMCLQQPQQMCLKTLVWLLLSFTAIWHVCLLNKRCPGFFGLEWQKTNNVIQPECSSSSLITERTYSPVHLTALVYCISVIPVTVKQNHQNMHLRPKTVCIVINVDKQRQTHAPCS